MRLQNEALRNLTIGRQNQPDCNRVLLRMAVGVQQRSLTGLQKTNRFMPSKAKQDRTRSD